jgi:hypothetical protein
MRDECKWLAYRQEKIYPMDEKISRRCGLMGVGVMVLLPLLSTIVALYFSPIKYLRDFEDFRFLIFAPLGISIMWMLGYFIGKKGENTQNVNFAFLAGGVLAGLIGTIFILPIITVFVCIYGMGKGVLFISLVIILGVIYICAGSISAGWAAIMARDYRNFQRVRILPQYTISELFILITLAAGIFSSIMSISLLLSRNPGF